LNIEQSQTWILFQDSLLQHSEASRSKTSDTQIRVPRTHGLPKTAVGIDPDPRQKFIILAPVFGLRTSVFLLLHSSLITHPLKATCCLTIMSAEIIDAQFAAFDNALERSDGDGFAAVVGHNYLSAIRVPPFLVAPLLGHFHEVMPAQDANYILRIADGKSRTH
jgi:hypothetical protein